jgi:hypothetical protein
MYIINIIIILDFKKHIQEKVANKDNLYIN